MARPFYPFVDNDPDKDETAGTTPSNDPRRSLAEGMVNYAARIAVYDDAAAAPRVVIVDPKDVRSYLEEITSQVTKLSHDQGGTIPFMVIREVVENFIHAYFIEPTITILNGGNTIRFSDQGPGIKEKDRALEYGTSSATEEMKQYIRGVGSGLPYAQQYMVDKGGSLTIEDNISQGTVVTISTAPASGDNVRPHGVAPRQDLAPAPAQPPAPDQYVQSYPAYQQPYYPQPQQGYPQQQGYPAPWPAAPAYAQQQAYQQPYQPQPQPQQQPPAAPLPQPAPSVPTAPSDNPFSWISLSARGRAILDYLAQHESVGPTELAREYGESQPTWTRELKALEEDGLVKKDGQKRRLTHLGQAYLSSLS